MCLYFGLFKCDLIYMICYLYVVCLFIWDLDYVRYSILDFNIVIIIKF